MSALIGPHTSLVSDWSTLGQGNCELPKKKLKSTTANAIVLENFLNG